MGTGAKALATMDFERLNLSASQVRILIYALASEVPPHSLRKGMRNIKSRLALHHLRVGPGADSSSVGMNHVRYLSEVQSVV